VLHAAHAGALVGRPAELRRHVDVLALVQALVRGRDLADGRGRSRGAAGHVGARAEAAGTALGAREPDPVDFRPTTLRERALMWRRTYGLFRRALAR